MLNVRAGSGWGFDRASLIARSTERGNNPNREDKGRYESGQPARAHVTCYPHD